MNDSAILKISKKLTERPSDFCKNRGACIIKKGKPITTALMDIEGLNCAFAKEDIDPIRNQAKALKI